MWVQRLLPHLKKEGEKMICPKCKEMCKYLGATVGGAKLYGCSICKGVFVNGLREKLR